MEVDMTKDEIILAQQARIEQLKDAINNLEGALDESWLYRDYPVTYTALLEALAIPDDLSALRAHDVALENCRLFAARNRNEEWAKTILRFCGEAGIIGSPLRAGAIEKGGE